MVLAKIDSDNFKGFILSTDDEIEDFFSNFNLSPTDAYKLQRPYYQHPIKSLEDLFNEWLSSLSDEFPETYIISKKAREFWNELYNSKKVHNPDELLIEWINTEYSLFKLLEYERFRERLEVPFKTVDEFVKCANSLLNRRKARAGQSLENHLAHTFDSQSIPYSWGKVTEKNNKPDFIFPGIDKYHDTSYPADKLVFLAAKTTCKDRWRQILEEAVRIPCKHLLTLQQGISAKQLTQMDEAGVRLIVPKDYQKYYPKEFIPKILTFEAFIVNLKYIGYL